MRKLIDTLTQQLRSFAEQREDLLLLAACSSADSAIVMKVARDVDRSSPSDCYLLFADDFHDSPSYVNTAIARLQEEHRLANEVRSTAGDTPLSPLPVSLHDATRPAAARLHEAMAFARSLLPGEGGHRLVWVMMPAHVADWPAYLKLVSSCAPRPQVEPWMRGLRLVFRVEPGFRAGSGPFAKAERTRVIAVDFGPAALEESLRQEASDKRLSLGERTQAMLSLALLDSAHGRFPQAISRFRQLLGHFQKTANVLMQAIVLNGLGDVAQRQGDLDLARHWYECAVTQGVAAEQPVVLATVVQNLAVVSYQQQRWDEAEQYYDHLTQLKHGMLDEDGKAMALEWRGLCQEKQNAWDRAMLSWEESAMLARVFELRTRLRPNLEHLRRAYRQLRLNDKLQALDAELKTLS